MFPGDIVSAGTNTNVMFKKMRASQIGAMEHARRKTLLIAKIGLAVLCIIVVFPIALIIKYIGVGIFGLGGWKTIGHQNFAINGVSQIQPAAEMEELFDDCRHSILWEQDSGSTWNATAFFGERYKLTMRVPVEIMSKNSGSMNGEPKFHLHEVESVSISPSGGVSVSFSEVFKFDATQWNKVYSSGGDFGSIGFMIKTDPVNNFQKFADASHP